MNYIKLQQDILKAKFIEDTKGRQSPFWYGLYKESVAIIIDGHYIVFIPKCAFYLDLDKIFPKVKPANINTIIKCINEAEPIQDTRAMRIVADDQKVRIFSGKNDQIWIADDLFKYFSKDVTEYRGIDKKSPIFLYEYEVLVGVLYPVNHA